MRLSTKGRYGVRALLDIAVHGDGGPVLLKDIAERQQVSALYLEHVMAPLIRAGILRSIRGAKGGMVLAKPPAEVRLSHVLEVLEGSMALVECVDNAGLCPRAEDCVAREVWMELKAAIDGVLESWTLQDLVERQKQKAVGKSGTYAI
ncbi:MAG: Rrf2 family transcriptional regulator [Dehalococcoidia bacterium]|nr:Rrf2 family transcriptional regulator [Dehalococcoidia bacterium]